MYLSYKDGTLSIMQIRQYINAIWWCLPLFTYSLDANAWGLYTHLHFAQHLLLASPLLDKRFRQAIKNFPELVLAGACLPDLAVISKQFNTTHQWQKAEYLLQSAENEAHIAIAVGYASHLFVDVIAHNHFVPAHEALWTHESMATHIASEWAMDAHISHTLQGKPGQVLSKHATMISEFIAPCFEKSTALVKRKVLHLAYADRLLRLAKIPSLIYFAIRMNNRDKHKHFDYYINKTMRALSQFHRVIKGHHPSWQPEFTASDHFSLAEWRELCLQHLHQHHSTPIRYYEASQ